MAPRTPQASANAAFGAAVTLLLRQLERDIMEAHGLSVGTPLHTSLNRPIAPPAFQEPPLPPLPPDLTQEANAPQPEVPDLVAREKPKLLKLPSQVIERIVAASAPVLLGTQTDAESKIVESEPALKDRSLPPGEECSRAPECPGSTDLVLPVYSSTSKNAMAPTGTELSRSMTAQCSASAMMLWTTWTEARLSEASQPSSAPALTLTFSTTFFSFPSSTSLCVGHTLNGSSPLRRLAVSPNNLVLQGWTGFGVALLICDIMFIPLMAFDLNDSMIFSFIIAIYWTVDILLNCFVGLTREDGIIDMRLWSIIRSYSRSWLLPDAMITMTHWVVMILEFLGPSDYAVLWNGSGSMRVSESFRMLRLLRALRILRIFKLWDMLKSTNWILRSEYLVVLADLGIQLVLILTLAHYVACSWYALGRFNLDDEKTWVDELDRMGSGVTWRYISSLHWSLTQFTPATTDIAPTNARERFFSVGVVIFALVAFSSFLSTITSRMTLLRNISGARSTESLRIRRFFAQHTVSYRLAMLILTFFRSNYEQHKGLLHESDIAFFAILPARLKAKLREEVYIPAFVTHQMLSRLVDLDGTAATSLCCDAMSECGFSPMQVVFSKGDEAESALFVVRGKLNLQERGVTHSVDSKTWVSEACLWLRWRHKGRLQAESVCELMLLSSFGFRQVVDASFELKQRLRGYAWNFLETEELHTDLPGQEDTLRTFAEDALAPHCDRNASNQSQNSLRPIAIVKARLGQIKLYDFFRFGIQRD